VSQFSLSKLSLFRPGEKVRIILIKTIKDKK
jgi:hypothetical protein